MNLGKIRDAVFSQADWGPKQSKDAKDRVDTFVNRAHDLLCMEAPFLFFEDEVHLATQPDAAPSLSTDTLHTIGSNFSFEFNGNHQGVADSAPKIVFKKTADFSLSLWFKRSSTVGSLQTLLSTLDGSADGGYEITFDASNYLNFKIADTSGNEIQIRTADTYTNDSKWHCVTCTYEGTGSDTGTVDAMSIHVDGVTTATPASVSTTALSADINGANTLRVGASASGDRYTGHLDEIAIFNAVLSADSVADIWNALPGSADGGVPIPLDSFDSLKGWWRMGEGSTSPTINDEVATATDLTMADVSTGVTPTFSVDTARSFDPWILQTNLSADTSSVLAWAHDGSWGGRMIEIRDGDGTYHRHEIRQVFRTATISDLNRSVGGLATRYKFRIVLSEPWHVGDGADHVTGLTYRVYTPQYYLPADVVQVSSLKLFQQNDVWPMTIIGQDEAEAKSLVEPHRNIAAGRPRVAFRRSHKQIDAPSRKPSFEQIDPESADSFPWQGPEPGGSFEYVYTYCMGIRDSEFRDWNPTVTPNAIEDVFAWAHTTTGLSSLRDERFYNELLEMDNRPHYEPLWESSPSPVSNEMTVETHHSTGGVTAAQKAWKVYLSDVDYHHGFGLVNKPSYHLSGIRKRIYRRRKSVSQLPQWTGISKENVEISDAFYLWMEVPGWVPFVVENGGVVPDYKRRLKTFHGYQAVRLYPNPDNRYELDIRCIRRPQTLENDEDAPRLHAEAVDLLIQRTLSMLYESQGNQVASAAAAAKYDRGLMLLSKRYGDLRPSARPIYRRPARAAPGWRQRQSWRQWWTTDS